LFERKAFAGGTPVEAIEAVEFMKFERIVVTLL
jgi:hypothetical protein